MFPENGQGAIYCTLSTRTGAVKCTGNSALSCFSGFLKILPVFIAMSMSNRGQY